MTHLDIYKCDRKRCREEKPAVYQDGTNSDVIVGPRPPDGWFLLAARLRGKDLTFCSLDCLSIWARAERAAMGVPA